jgi:hypothetical protein
MSHIDPVRHPRLHRVSQGAKWLGQDGYPAWSFVADEHEQWLKLIETRAGQAGLDHYVNKLQEEAKRRDEFLAELAVAYFLDARCGLPIVRLEPPGAAGKTGEFLVQLPDKREMFVEVKSPGWESQVVQDEVATLGGKPLRGRPDRLNQPKYVHGETRSYNHTQCVRDTVAKAYPKMLDTAPTLLVINDDLVPSLTDSLDMVKHALFGKRLIDPQHPAAQYQPRWWQDDGCFLDHRYERLGAVGVFSCVPEDPYRYSFKLFQNPHALRTVRVPSRRFAKRLNDDARSYLPFVLGAVGVAFIAAAIAYSLRE